MLVHLSLIPWIKHRLLHMLCPTYALQKHALPSIHILCAASQACTEVWFAQVACAQIFAVRLLAQSMIRSPLCCVESASGVHELQPAAASCHAAQPTQQLRHLHWLQSRFPGAQGGQDRGGGRGGRGDGVRAHYRLCQGCRPPGLLQRPQGLQATLL